MLVIDQKCQTWLEESTKLSDVIGDWGKRFLTQYFVGESLKIGRLKSLLVVVTRFLNYKPILYRRYVIYKRKIKSFEEFVRGYAEEVNMNRKRILKYANQKAGS